MPVGGWSLAIISADIWGKTLTGSRLRASIRGRVPSSWGAYAAEWSGLWTPPRPRRTALWGTRWGQTDSSGLPITYCVLGASSWGHLRWPPTLVTKIRLPRGAFRASPDTRIQDSYLVDSASSHMLVSKIKPCMSKYKQLYRETANGSLNQLSFI